MVHLPVLVEALAAGQDQVAVRAGVGSRRAAQRASHARGLEQGGHALGVAGQDGGPGGPIRQGQTISRVSRRPSHAQLPSLPNPTKHISLKTKENFS